MPDKKRPSSTMVEVPIGIEKVLYIAATEPGFRRDLLEDREAALRARDLELRSTELAMLRATPAEQLEAAIEGLDVSEQGSGRRRFMRTVAAAAVTLAAGEVLTACEPNLDGGSRPDDPYEDAGTEEPDGG
jgi:hypothetical protein